MSETLADDLLAARDALLMRGMAKGKLEDAQGRVCMEGALNVALGRPGLSAGERWTAAHQALICAIRRRVGRFACVSTWNDDPATTVVDGLEVFDEAIRRAKDDET